MNPHDATIPESTVRAGAPATTSEGATVVVAMSGGVDSSAVAAMLASQGYNVIGVTMQLWDQNRLGLAGGSAAGRCCSLNDVYDARRVAEHLKVPYYVVNFQQNFEATVVRPFVAEYLAGRTPIPCTLCNNHVKFDQLMVTARQIGAEKLATGHYARVEYDAERKRYLLRRAVDETKDQSYFLFGLTQSLTRDGGKLFLDEKIASDFDPLEIGKALAPQFAGMQKILRNRCHRSSRRLQPSRPDKKLQPGRELPLAGGSRS